MKTKFMIRKKLIVFASCLLVAIMLIPAASFASAFAYDAEDVSTVQGVENNVNLIEERENYNNKIKEKFNDIQEKEITAFQVEENIALLEEQLASKDTDVLTQLNKQIDEYNNMLADEAFAEEREKIQTLIDIIQQLVPEYQLYQSYRNDSYNIDSYTTQGNPFFPDPSNPYFPDPIVPGGDPYTAYLAYVTTVITVSYELGYKLMSELTSMSLISRNTDYYPINSSRVLASPLLYEIAIGNQAGSSSNPIETEFPETDWFNTYQKDLRLAIRGFSCYKPTANSKTVYIRDDYNYHPKGQTGHDDDGLPYELMYNAQLLGVIKPYVVRINVDTSEFLRLQIGPKIGITWKMAVTNYKNTAVDVVYNTKMCFESDAKNWTGLTDIKTARVPANSTLIVDIQENLLATHFAFSYNDGGTRIITYAHETYLSPNNNLNPDISKVTYPYYNNIGIVGKNGGTWLINVKNTYGAGRMLEYNYKMCFESDAKNWTGLNHLSGFYLENGENRIIEIQENVFATHIAVSFVSETERNIRYANQLNANCTMNVLSNTLYIYNYLKLSNSGKSGSSWLINITNPTGSTITVYYNAKMCNAGDAKNWTGLSHVTSITLSAYQTKQVAISTNVLATHITTSYFSNGKRVISYANGLSTSGGISVGYNYI